MNPDGLETALDYSLSFLRQFSPTLNSIDNSNSNSNSTSHAGPHANPARSRINAKPTQTLSSPAGVDLPGVPHPVIMTERLGTPLHSRGITSELLFEGYSVPSVCFGVDGLFAWEYRMRGGVGAGPSTGAIVGAGAGAGGVGKGTSDGLVINMGHHSTTIIPVLDSRGLVDRAKRSVCSLQSRSISLSFSISRSFSTCRFEQAVEDEREEVTREGEKRGS